VGCGRTSCSFPIKRKGRREPKERIKSVETDWPASAVCHRPGCVTSSSTDCPRRLKTKCSGKNRIGGRLYHPHQLNSPAKQPPNSLPHQGRRSSGLMAREKPRSIPAPRGRANKTLRGRRKRRRQAAGRATTHKRRGIGLSRPRECRTGEFYFCQ